MSQNDRSEEEPASSGHLVVHCPRPKLRRRLTCKEKEKKKMLEYNINKEESDRRESDTGSEKNGVQKQYRKLSNRKRSFNGRLRFAQYAKETESERE